MDPSTFRSWLWRMTQDFDTLSGLQRTLTLYHLMKRKTVPYHSLLARTYHCVRENPGLTLPDSDGGTDEELRLFFEYLDSLVSIKQQGDTRPVSDRFSPPQPSASMTATFSSSRQPMFRASQPSTSQTRPSSSQARPTSQTRPSRAAPMSASTYREPAASLDSDAMTTQSDDSEPDSAAPKTSRKRKAQSPAGAKQPAAKKRAAQKPVGERISDNAVKIDGVVYPAGALPSARVPQPTVDKDSADSAEDRESAGSSSIVSSTTKRGKTSRAGRKSTPAALSAGDSLTADADVSLNTSKSFGVQASVKSGSARRFSDVVPNNIIPGMGRVNVAGLKPAPTAETSSKKRGRKGAGK